MDVAGRDRIANTEKRECTLRVAADFLAAALQQCRVVHFPKVAAGRLELEVEVIQG
jgi:hypothetical protein